jgi:membrane-associated protein
VPCGVQRGNTTKSEAANDALREREGDFDLVEVDVGALADAAGAWSYLLLFVLATGESSAFLGFVVPGEMVVLAAGVLSDQGILDWRLVAPAVVTGAVVGDTIGYALGHRFGNVAAVRWLSRGRLPDLRSRSAEFFERHGGAAVFWGRFVGFLRPLVAFAAGASHMPYRAFLFYNIAGAVVWGSATLLVGVIIGETAERLLHSFSFATATVVLLGVALTASIRLHRRRFRIGAASPRVDDAGTAPRREIPRGR